MKSVLFITTGGTIASTKSDNGLVPNSGKAAFDKFLKSIENECKVKVLPLFSLDSTNVHSVHWLRLVQTVKESYSDYDAFVISHGTDTMAYTSAALSVLIQNSRKPVVLTGSQLPIEDENTDAYDNLRLAFMYALSDKANSVHIAFGGKIINGRNARKVKSRSPDAFSSINTEDTARLVGDELVFNNVSEINGETVFYDRLETRVLNIKLTPDIPVKAYEGVHNYVKGVIIEGFGLSGILNYENSEVEDLIRTLTRNGVRVVFATQTHLEGTDLSVYNVGARLKREIKLLETGEMTNEYALVKMMWSLAESETEEEFRERFLSE